MTNPSKLSVKIHDKTQLETVLSYDFASGEKEENRKRKQKYEVDVYFFFPPQLNINKTTYSKEDFYEDIRPLLRLKEPSYSYEDFLSKGGDYDKSPFCFLREKLGKISDSSEKTDYQDLLGELKILGCSLSSHLSKKGKELNRELKSLGKKKRDSNADSLFFGKSYIKLKEIFLVFREWENLVTFIHSQKEESHEIFRKEVSLLDENLLYVFYRFISGVVFTYEKYFSLVTSESSKKFSRRLQALLSFIFYHYKKKSYFRLKLDSTRYEKESYSMRLSYLKKRMWQVLYLEVKDKASLFRKRQISYIAAAGFAAMWALFANFLIWHELNFQGYSSFLDYSDSFFGLSSYLLIVAFVSTYILKDRIKDFARDKFQGSIFKHLPDSTEQIWYFDRVRNKRLSIGLVYESQKYIQGSESLPEEIAEYRSNRLQGRIIDQEDIIHYHKKINLDTKRIRKLGKDLTAIQDIIRLSVKRYVTRLDDPEEASYLMGKEGSMQVTTLPKVYYIDIVVKYSKKELAQNKETVVFECRRLLINKEGLMRVVVS